MFFTHSVHQSEHVSQRLCLVNLLADFGIHTGTQLMLARIEGCKSFLWQSRRNYNGAPGKLVRESRLWLRFWCIVGGDHSKVNNTVVLGTAVQRTEGTQTLNCPVTSKDVKVDYKNNDRFVMFLSIRSLRLFIRVFFGKKLTALECLIITFASN
jgi:hypothetical protein